METKTLLTWGEEQGFGGVATSYPAYGNLMWHSHDEAGYAHVQMGKEVGNFTNASFGI